MNQETQQNTTENKKPRTYVSFIITLLYLLTLIIFAFILIIMYKIQNSQVAVNVFLLNLPGALSEAHEEWTGFMVPLWLFGLGEIFILVASFTKKPIGYVNTGLINFVACTPFVIIMLFIMMSLFITGGLGYSGGLFLWTILPGFLFAVFVILMNSKFQKSEDELLSRQ